MGRGAAGGRGGGGPGVVAGAPKGMVAGRDPPYAGLAVCGDVEGGSRPALRHELWAVTRKWLALGDECWPVAVECAALGGE